MEKFIQKIEEALGDLREKAAQLIAEVQELLRRMKVQKVNPSDANEKRPKALWVHLKQQPGYPTISIIWSRVLYFHQGTKRPFFRDIPKGRGFGIPQGKFMGYVRGYHPEVQAGLWSFETEFAEIRRRQSLLSRARALLIQYQKAATKPIEKGD